MLFFIELRGLREIIGWLLTFGFKSSVLVLFAGALVEGAAAWVSSLLALAASFALCFSRLLSSLLLQIFIDQLLEKRNESYRLDALLGNHFARYRVLVRPCRWLLFGRHGATVAGSCLVRYRCWSKR
jgi:hypothetical protein